LNTPTATDEQMDTNKKIRETISAFADSELPEADQELALAALREADGRDTWSLYHRIGDILRAEPGAADLSPGFEACLAAKLDAEPLPLRRGAAKPALPTDALAAIAPTVVAGVDSVNGAKMAVQPAQSAQPVTALAPGAPHDGGPHEGAAAEAGSARAKRL
jgi:sigma-E factor negative regulatory protein RseA